MNIFNLLGTAVIYDNNLQNVPLNELGITAFVGKVIETLSFGGTLAIGILLFSLILKILPLPFDIYSRAATKKNALKMEKMRPELERLQKQYSNNKELYNQKLMALYKKQGYSQFSACLPSIITLVFFMIVISAFQQYSVYCKIDVFNQMATSYSESIRYNEYNMRPIIASVVKEIITENKNLIIGQVIEVAAAKLSKEALPKLIERMTKQYENHK
jgi:membrane protein insertase Oxa1/YidC/SpoIIIJ